MRNCHHSPALAHVFCALHVGKYVQRANGNPRAHEVGNGYHRSFDVVATECRQAIVIVSIVLMASYLWPTLVMKRTFHLCPR